MPERVEIPLSWANGLLLSEDESLMPEGFAPELQNYVPRPNGGLRARRGWRNGSVAGSIPATRRVRGIGVFPSVASYGTPTLVKNSADEFLFDDLTTTGSGLSWGQPTVQGNLCLAAILAKARPKRVQAVAGSVVTHVSVPGTVLSPSASWSSPTTSGNLALAVVIAGTQGESPDTADIGTPAGWTLRATLVPTWPASGWEDVQIRVFEIQNVGVRSGAETFTVTFSRSDFLHYAQVFLVEVSGVLTAAAFDVSATAEGTSTAASTGTTAATAQGDEFVLGAIFNVSGAQTDPGGPQVEILTTSSGQWQAALYEKRPEVTGTQTMTATVSPSQDWAGVIVAYKALTTAPTITPPAGWTLVQSDTEGPMRNSLYHVVQAASRSGAETFTFDRSCAIESYLLEFEGTGEHDAVVSAVASGTSTAPSVSDVDSTTMVANQKALVLGLVGVGTKDVAQSAPTNNMVEGAGGGTGARLIVYWKVITVNAAQSFGVTLSASAPWVAALTAYKSALGSVSAGSYLVAHDDLTNFDIWAIDRDSLDSGVWTEIDPNLTATNRQLPVAFASGLGVILYTHPNFANTRSYNGTAASNVAAAPEGRAIAFYRNRFFIGGSAANPTRLWYSDLGSSTSWPALSFLEVNQEDGEPIEDIAPTEDGLLIAKRSSLWFLAGTGPDSFELHRLGGHAGGHPGRCIHWTSHGAIIAGRHSVWLWSGGEPQAVSRAIEEQYELGGSFVSTACDGDVIFVCDSGNGTIWSYDIPNQTWTRENVNAAGEFPAHIIMNGSELIYGPSAGTVTSLLAYRDEALGVRARDHLAETFLAHTGEMWIGEAQRPFTPKSLYLQIRQRGGGAGDAPLVLTPKYEGEAQASQNIEPRAGGSQTFRERLDVGYEQGLMKVQFLFKQIMTTTDDAVLELERATLVGLVGEPW